MFMPQMAFRITMIIFVAAAVNLLITIGLGTAYYFDLLSLFPRSWATLALLGGLLALWSYLVIWRTPQAVLDRWPHWFIYGYLLPMLGGPLSVMIALICHIHATTVI